MSAVSVFRTILESVNDQNVFYVFPSQTAAACWAEKICLYGGIRSVAADRFMAWDRFKETAAQRETGDRRPVSSLIRRLFARRLAEENAAAPFLSSVIPADFSRDGGIFAPSIAGILGSLALWEKKHGTRQDDEEDRDLRIIKGEYTAFMEDRNLFEPSWEKPAFHQTGRRYIIFFPEALADFEEYREPLLSRGAVLYPAENTGEKPGLLFFESARTEIRAAVNELMRLHKEEGLPYEDAALSIPGFEHTAPYVIRELALHDIPFSIRAGKSLGDYPIGRLFSLAGEAVSLGFSFDSLKSLILNSGIPWKDPEMNRALIRFGIENHCAAPFNDRGRIADAWEEGFKRKNIPAEDPLAAHYGELKKSLCAMVSAGSFRQILEKYFIFRGFLDTEKCGPESDAVLARCVEELSVLAETEEEFPELACPAAYGFFVSHLKEKNYVPVQQGGGVNIYDYPSAAGAPFGCHIVLNASQAAASVQRRPLAFLRQDKRARLGIEDRDVSARLLSLYSIAPWKDYACRTRISASEKTFSGWAIPHSAFALDTNDFRDSLEKAAGSFDPFTAERRWWAGTGGPPPLFSVQRKGFEQWSRILFSGENTGGPCGVPRSGFSGPVAELLRQRIRSKNIKDTESPAAAAAELSVSATDLNEFFRCPVLWLFKRIFRLEPCRQDAALLDDESRGLIYHEILLRLFTRIQENHKKFLTGELELYFEWVKECTNLVLQSDDTLKGPLVYPLLASLGEAVNKRLRRLLKTEAGYFAGFEIKALEQRYDLPRGQLRLTGRIDRISLSPEGPMIIDYKTNAAPSKNKSRTKQSDDEENGLEDFQIPMYIKLYEAAEGQKVNRAFFFSINKHEVVPVIGPLQGKRDLCSRDEYEPSMEELEKGIDSFDSAVSGLDFRPRKIPYKTCTSCAYKTVCRSLFF